MENNYMTYIEPNYVSGLEDTDGNNIMLTNDYEDYCVAVDLAIEIRGRHVASGQLGTNRRIILHWVDSERESRSFLGGSDVGGNARVLTSAPTEVFINDIRQENSYGMENIGISSISVRYNHYMVPEVEIDFVDVRGAALFMPEEMRHHYVDGSGMDGVVDRDISGSVFQSFFSFPYPKYTLVVKGFYGQPVSYSLSCSKFTTELDSGDGNFHMRASFVGYSFSFLNDVSYNAMMCAPNSKIGSEYWDSKVRNGEFTLNDDNFGGIVPVCKISDIVDSLKGMKGDLEMVKNDEDVVNERNDMDRNISLLTEILSKAKKVEDTLRQCDYTNTKDPNGLFDADNGRLYMIGGKAVGEEKVKESLKELSDEVKKYNEKGTPKIDMGFYLTVAGSLKYSNEDGVFVLEGAEHGRVAARIAELQKENEGLYDKKTNTVWVYDIKPVFDSINGAIRTNNEAKNRLETKIRDLMASMVATKLGFTPTIENMTKTLMAHLETLVYMIHDTAKKADDTKRLMEDLGLGGGRMYDFVSTNGEVIVPPFPQASTGTEDTERKCEDEWLGDIVPSSSASKVKEIDLVEDLLSGVRYMKSVVDDYVRSDNEAPSYVSAKGLPNIYCQYPILPLDYLTSESPFGNNIDFNDWTDIAIRCWLRFRQHAADYDMDGDSDSDKFSKYLKTSGVIDAYNLTKDITLSESTLSTLECMDVNTLKKILKREADEYSKDGVYAWDRITGGGDGFGINGLYIQGYDLSGSGETTNDGEYVNNRYSENECDGVRCFYILEEPDLVDRLRRSKYRNIKIGSYNFTAENTEEGYETINKRFVWANDELYKSYHLEYMSSPNEIVNLLPKWDSVVTGTSFSYVDYENKGYILPRKRDSIADEKRDGYDERFSWENGYGNDAKHNGIYLKRFFNHGNENRSLFENNAFEGITNYKDYAKKFSYTKIQGPRNSAGDLLHSKENENHVECIFGNKSYYDNDERELSVDDRAYMFLLNAGVYYSTNMTNITNVVGAVSENDNFWYQMLFEKDRGNGARASHLAFELMPKVAVLMVGCALKVDKNPEVTGVVHKYNNRTNWIERNLTEIDKKFFVEYYEEWVNTEFKEIDKKYSLRRPDGRRFTEDDVEELIKICKEHEKKNTSGYEFVSKLKEMLNDSFFEHYECAFYGTDDEVLLYFREGTEDNDKMTELMTMPTLVARPFRRYQVDEEWYEGKYVDEFDIYLNGILEGLHLKYKGEIDELKNTGDDSVIPATSTPKDVKIALYKWLKSFYDRWLAGLTGYDPFMVRNLINERDTYENATNPSPNRFFFVDSYYNKVGNRVLIDMEEFVADTIRSQSADSYSLMSVYGMMMQKNRMNLFIIPNFLDMSNAAEMESMFRPVPYVEMKRPDNMDCFVAMYCTEPSSKLNIPGSEYEDDSYLITDVEEKLPTAITSKNPQNGYKIPAFGVSYGGQYQSYFTDINVGMDSNMVTEQSIKAMFDIADMGSKTGGGENGRGTKFLGQDLYTVYANNSYECTLTMMGCAWVRPTMYFALLNVPLFRGTYMVKKVTHQITPGYMRTTVVGVRLPKIATPIVRTTITSDAESMAAVMELLSNRATAMSDIGNDCGYKRFPAYDPSAATVTEKYLRETMVNSVAANTRNAGKPGYYAADVSLLDALACTLNAEAGNQDLLGQELVAAVFYNRWRHSNGSWNLLFRPGQIAFTSDNAKYEHVKKRGGEVFDGLRDVIIKTFTETPARLVGKVTSVDKPTVIYANNEPTSEMTGPSEITIEDVQKLYMYCTTEGYSPNNTPEARETKRYLESNPEYWRKCEYILHHKGHVFTGGPQGGIPSKAKWTSVLSSEDSGKDENELLFDRLLMTCEYTTAIGENAAKIGPDDDGYRNITCAEGKGAKVFDALATTYSDELESVQWVINDENDAAKSEPAYIRFKAGKDSEVGKRSVSMVLKGSHSVYGGSADTMSKNYMTTVSKMYGHRTKEGVASRNADMMPPEIGWMSGSGDTSEERTISAMAAINDAGKSVAPCPARGRDSVSSLYMESKGWTWDGSDEPANKKKIPDGKLGKPFDADKAVNGMWESGGAYNTEKYLCATAVSRALMRGFGVDTLERPTSACRYAEGYMEYYGFEKIGEGVIDGNNRPSNITADGTRGPNGYSNGYTPEKGDVIVIAGMDVANKNKRHGHIQIYNGTNWCCDKQYPRIFPYPQTGRPYRIYRFPSA